MDAGGLLVLIVVFALLGSLGGIGTGLVPGIHVNTVALLVVVASPAFLGAVAALLPMEDGIMLLAAFLAAAAVAHGIAALLPAVFLGAPDPDNALSVLPGHRLLALGRGREAVLLGARGALLGTWLALAALPAFRLLLGPPVDAYARLRPILPFLLVLLVALLLATEGTGDPKRDAIRRAKALGLLLVSGLLGGVVLQPGFLRDGGAPLPLDAASLVLFPLLTGLFGLPTLIQSMRSRGRLPPQDLGSPEPLPGWRRTRGLLSGTLAGAGVSWIPGLGGTNATVVAQLLAGGEPHRVDPDADREFLFAAGAAGAATTVFTFAALFVILRARSGAAAGLDALAGGVDAWTLVGYVPPLLAAVLLASAVSATLAYVATTRLARPFAVLAGRVRYGRLARVVAAGLVGAVFLTTGPLGVLVLGTATAIGLVPPLTGVRRVHLMGCLLIPILAGPI